VTSSVLKRNRIKREERLKNSTRIGYILRNGKRLRGNYVSIYFVNSEKPAFAVLVKNKTGNSVQRNHAKRWVREIYRQTKHEIKQFCHILVLVDKPYLQLDYQKIKTDLDHLLPKLDNVNKE